MVPSLAGELANKLWHGAAGDSLDIKRFCERACYKVRILDRGQPNKLNTRREPICDRRRYCQRQTGFSGTARARQGQQTGCHFGAATQRPASPVALDQ